MRCLFANSSTVCGSSALPTTYSPPDAVTRSMMSGFSCWMTAYSRTSSARRTANAPSRPPPPTMRNLPLSMTACLRRLKKRFQEPGVRGITARRGGQAAVGKPESGIPSHKPGGSLRQTRRMKARMTCILQRRDRRYRMDPWQAQKQKAYDRPGYCCFRLLLRD